MAAQRDQVLSILSSHADEIRRLGVNHLALFGSTVRNEARDDSDIDILVDIDETRRFSLVDLSTLHLYLNDLLNQRVEIAQRKLLRPRLRKRIVAEAVEIF